MSVTVYEFDDDVPLPKRRGRPARVAIAAEIPFGHFPLGKSYLVRGAKQSTVSAAAAAYERRFPKLKFATRYFEVDPKAAVAGVRVWRVR